MIWTTVAILVQSNVNAEQCGTRMATYLGKLYITDTTTCNRIKFKAIFMVYAKCAFSRARETITPKNEKRKKCRARGRERDGTLCSHALLSLFVCSCRIYQTVDTHTHALTNKKICNISWPYNEMSVHKKALNSKAFWADDDHHRKPKTIFVGNGKWDRQQISFPMRTVFNAKRLWIPSRWTKKIARGTHARNNCCWKGKIHQ